MTGSGKARTAFGALARAGRRPPWEEELLMGHAAEVVPARPVIEERESYAILAAMKPEQRNDAVLGMARWLAEHEHRELHAVSVIETAPLVSAFAAGVPVVPPFHDEERRRAIEREIRAAHERSGHSASRFRVDVVEGSAPATIADIAREREVHMLVIGRGTHGLLSHLVFGEQVMEIIRRSRSPVLVVPPDLSVPIVRAMVAFDGSPASIRAAAAAHEMIGAGGLLTLVHVATQRPVTGGRAHWWGRSIDRRARETLQAFARALPARAGVRVQTEKLHGNPVDVLTAYAQSYEMQLLACGWREHALAERLFAERGTASLLHRAMCAVLVAPEPRGDDRDRAG